MDSSDLTDALMENGAQVAQQALESGNQRHYETVMREWSQLDPSAATMFGQLKQAEYRAWQAEQAAQQMLQPMQQQQHLGVIAQAWESMARDHPDVEQFRDAIAQEANRIQQLTGRHLVTEMVRSGDQQQIREALQVLYERARGRGSDTLVQAATQAARAHAQESQRFREDAAVTSATATETAPPQTSADRLAQSWEEKDRPFLEGWNV
jgi:hypothetical protein